MPPIREHRRMTGYRCRAWSASVGLHLLAAGVAWGVTAPGRDHRAELIGETSRVELTVTMPQATPDCPPPAPAEATATVRITPSEAEVARRPFRAESTDVSRPTPDERQRVDRWLADATPPTRAREHRVEPTPAARPSTRPVRRAALSPMRTQPGTVDRPLPELVRSPPPTYPLSAIERQVEGTVLLRLRVDREGRVAGVEIARSSGHPVLDAEAVRAVRAWRFVPASRAGRAVASTVKLPVRFDLSAER